MMFVKYIAVCVADLLRPRHAGLVNFTIAHD